VLNASRYTCSEGTNDWHKALVFESLWKFQDCLDGDLFARGRGVCGTLRKLQVNVSVQLEFEASLMCATELRLRGWRVKDEADLERKRTILERLIYADILEKARTGEIRANDARRGFVRKKF